MLVGVGGGAAIFGLVVGGVLMACAKRPTARKLPLPNVQVASGLDTSAPMGAMDMRPNDAVLAAEAQADGL